MGCPQTKTAGLSGRMFFVFLTLSGFAAGNTLLPGSDEDKAILNLPSYDQFGMSLAPYIDIDKNGLKEILVGAPGDDKVGYHGGAVYIIFTRRDPYIPPPFNWLLYILIHVVLPILCVLFCCALTGCYCWFFRRIPDEVEVLVKQSGMELGLKKERTKLKKNPNAVYVDEYVT